jgi:hypothetical protein
MTYEIFQPNDSKHWITWPARIVGLLEMLTGLGVILLGFYTIITAIMDLGETPETILGEDLTTLFGGLFLIFMGVLIVIGVIIFVIGLGLWNISVFSLWLHILGIVLYLGNGLLSLPSTINPTDPQILSLVFTAVFGVYLLLVRSNFH